MEEDTHLMEDDDMFERIDKIIQESIRPVLKSDNGDIALVDVRDGVVTVALEKPKVPTAFSSFLMTFKVRKGCSCGRCAVPVVAVMEGVLKRLREEVPDVREVVVAKGV
jgi:Fe-S cluster biogenesis protein NfuA